MHVTNPRERLILLDWLRLWAFLAITVYHGTWILWPTKAGPPDPFPTAYWVFVSEFAYHSSYSGFTIVFVTAFVLGLKPRVFNGKRWLPLFLVGGWIVFSAILWLREPGGFVVAWDIYPFLIVTFIVSDVLLGRMSTSGRWIAVAGSTLTLLIPFWKLQEVLPLSDAWTMVLVGICPEDFADWPLFPWSALVFGGLALGQLYRDRPPSTDMRVRAWEWAWIALATFAFVWVNPHYYATPLGDGWTCYMFRRSPVLFWCYFVGILAIIRLSVDPSVQRWLSNNPIARFPSRLGINQRFFAAYLSHYLFLAGFALLFRASLVEHPILYDVSHGATVVLCELTARLFSLRRLERS
ncbi:MAG: heparan-alpha-glucosaminide N-acetyltransferase domain-containing protein [Myxococcota bacterium]